MRRKPPDILITTPESLYLMLTSRAREILDRRRGGDRRRDPRRRPVEARLPPGADAGAARRTCVDATRAADRSRPADRPLGHPAPAGADRAVPGRARSASARSSTPAAARSSTSRSSSRSRTWPNPGAAAPTPNAEDGESPRRPGSSRSTHHVALDLAGDLPGAAGAGPASTPRRSSSSTTAAAPSASPSA